MAARKSTRRSRGAAKTKTPPKNSTTTPSVDNVVTLVRPLPNVLILSSSACRILWRRRWLFLGIAAWYMLFNLLLVHGLSSLVDVNSIRSNFTSLATGKAGLFAGGALTYTQLVGTIGSGSTDTAGAYQISLFVVISLALIWALRQAYAAKIVRIRDAYYQGMYALVPFSLVLLVIGLRLLLLIAGALLYESVVSNGIAVNGFQQLLWGVLAIVMAVTSLYFVTTGIIALYIVTLPDMTPVKALRSARDLVKGRRWTVLRKMLFLPVGLLIVSAIITVPFIFIVPALAPWVFYILSVLALVVAHSYLYSLYRGLLHD